MVGRLLTPRTDHLISSKIGQRGSPSNSRSGSSGTDSNGNRWTRGPDVGLDGSEGRGSWSWQLGCSVGDGNGRDRGGDVGESRRGNYLLTVAAHPSTERIVENRGRRVSRVETHPGYASRRLAPTSVSGSWEDGAPSLTKPAFRTVATPFVLGKATNGPTWVSNICV